MLPAVAAGVAVVLVGAAAGAYLLYGRPASSDAPAKPTAGTEAPTRPAATQPAAAAVLDVCTMLPVAEVDRLVPQAAVAKRSRDAGSAVYSYCDLSNRRISHGEFWRSREIKASIAQHKGEGPKTGRAQAQALYDSELGFFTYKAKNEPTDEKKDPGRRTTTPLSSTIQGWATAPSASTPGVATSRCGTPSARAGPAWAT
ncbi:hypothetical protein [Nonomuraea recticatena]|uniref:hypothetical protein n=1 Tax=Nonomuraea recticatena TaxID=46178 RepID=UPI00361BA97C